jgi:hypothetical protein
MWLSQSPDKAAKSFKGKFSDDVERTVRNHFRRIFGEQAEYAEYQKWLITCADNANVRSILEASISGIKIHILKEFLFEYVLRAIENWKQGKQTMTLPSDKWLLHMIDVMEGRMIIAGIRTPAASA